AAPEGGRGEGRDGVRTRDRGKGRRAARMNASPHGPGIAEPPDAGSVNSGAVDGPGHRHRPAPAELRLGRNYWKLFSASAMTNLGDGLMSVAVVWLASSLTREALWISIVGVASRLPWLVFSLPAGVITDRFDRRRIVATMDVARF